MQVAYDDMLEAHTRGTVDILTAWSRDRVLEVVQADCARRHLVLRRGSWRKDGEEQTSCDTLPEVYRWRRAEVVL